MLCQQLQLTGGSRHSINAPRYVVRSKTGFVYINDESSNGGSIVLSGGCYETVGIWSCIIAQQRAFIPVKLPEDLIVEMLQFCAYKAKKHPPQLLQQEGTIC